MAISMAVMWCFHSVIGRMGTILSISVLLVILQPPAFSQSAKNTGGISGFVLDAQTKEPLIGANITILNSGRGAATNKAGYFMIPRLADSTYVLNVSYIGYNTASRKISVAGGEIVYLTFELEANPVLLQQIEVTADAFQEAEKPISTISLPVSRLKNRPAIGETDLLRTLQMLPGVQAAHELSSGLYIRGGSPDQNLILLDNITVYNPSHFFGFFSTFNNDAIKDVKLFKGGFPAEYGGRLSAVLDITNKEGNREAHRASGGISLISSKLLLEGPFPGGSFMISGRRTYFDLITRLLNSSEIPDYYFYDLNGKLNLDLANHDKLILSVYTGRDVLDYQEEEFNQLTNKIHIGWGNQVFSAQWRHLFNPRLFSTVTLAASRFSSRVEATNRDFPVFFENSIRDFSLKTDFEWFGFQQHVVKGGLWLTRNQFLNRFEVGEDTSFSNRLVTRPTYLACYLQDEWKISPLLTLNIGFRLNSFSEGRNLYFEPRVQLRRRLLDWLDFVLAGGVYNQFTTVVVNDLASFADLWYPIDGTVEAPLAEQYIAGFHSRLGRGIVLEVEGYVKPIHNLLEFKPLQETERTRLDEIFYTGSGMAKGLEIFLQKALGKMTGWIGYTWSRTERTFAELNDGEAFPAKWDFTHDFTATLSWNLSEKLVLGWTAVYRSGQAFTVPTGHYRLGPPEFSIDYLRAGKKNSARLEPYHRMDVSITYQFQKLGGQWMLALNVYNIYNHRNVWFRNYDFNRRGEPPDIEDVRLLPILPTLELRFEF